MLFCPLAKTKSVRDISNRLRCATGKLYHLGVQTAPLKSSLRYQNKHRHWELFRDCYFALLNSQRQFRTVGRLQADKVQDQEKAILAGQHHYAAFAFQYLCIVFD